MQPKPQPAPPSATIVSIPLWGTLWPCSVRRDGTVDLVMLKGSWFDAREMLRDTLCDALESEYRAMEPA